ncbi:DUF4974 domain-containing protein [Flagellimonas olearia]|uniref:DUF4974 domain-containing protein n=1 Tax=Flagellimonas olearia TaxID=552546 RepID=A0A6I1E0X1_9FLAO|nr:FecR domain-containing protein [Allomuricauda olearia]KAB7531506.1 DUF4974 domain-containing protein [Allomuricauda olearia]
MKYSSYSETDFLLDEYFQKWVLNPDPMTQSFWENWILNHPEKMDEVKSAANLLRLMNYKDDDVLKEDELDMIWQNIINKRKESGKNQFFTNRESYLNKKYVLKIAAVFIGLVASTLFVFQMGVFNATVDNGAQMVSKDDIILKLGDGSVEILDETSSKVLPNANGESIASKEQNKLIYGKKGSKVHKGINYNELMVPYGKTFELVLSDGSQVTLNSGSKLRYPVTFLANSPRTVYLEGEAFFSIEKDENSPFTVITDNMNTRVYGTKFNVSSYPDESVTTTVLIEGSVSVYKANNHNNQEPIIIEPGQRASIEKEQIVVDEVDVSNYIGWKEGKLIFSDSTFDDILKRLERHFNVKIENRLGQLKNKRFTGTFTKEPLDEILNVIQQHTLFEYQIDKNTIIVIEKE